MAVATDAAYIGGVQFINMALAAVRIHGDSDQFPAVAFQFAYAQYFELHCT